MERFRAEEGRHQERPYWQSRTAAILTVLKYTRRPKRTRAALTLREKSLSQRSPNRVPSTERPSVDANWAKVIKGPYFAISISAVDTVVIPLIS
jgi:hypothetical protein